MTTTTTTTTSHSGSETVPRVWNSRLRSGRAAATLSPSLMRRRLVQLAVLALVFSITPGALELVENVAHAMAHGDAAHVDDGGHSKGSPTDEDGCSGATHACSCCHSLRFIPVEGVAMIPVADLVTSDLSADATPVASARLWRVFRPPRS